MRLLTNLNEYVKSLFHALQRRRSDLHDYQIFASQFLRDNPFSALFIDCGLGKSVATLTAIIDMICEFSGDDLTLIIGPVRVVNETWPTEIATWRHTAGLSYTHVKDDVLVKEIDAAADRLRKLMKAMKRNAIARATASGELIDERAIDKHISLQIDRLRQLEAKAAVRRQLARTKATVHFINREQVEWLVDAWGREFPYKTVIIDESSSFKDYRSNRFKALRKVRPLLKRLHELTATPVAETYEDLFAQIYLLDEGKRLGKNITTYRKKYFDHNSYTHQYTLRPGAAEDITALISDICLVMKGEDYLPLEAPVFVTEKIILPESDMELYRTMERDYVIKLPSGVEIEAENAAAKNQKLQQMASGVIYENISRLDEFGEIKHERVVHHLHDHKIEKLKELAEATQGEPLLVAYYLKSSLARLQKAFPKAVTMDKAGKCVKDWNAGKIEMMFINPQGGGYGLNIQYGSHRLALFDIPWSFEQFYQTWRRICRQGQTHLVFVHFMVVVGTIDELIVQALTDKDMTQEKFFSLLKSLQRKMKKGELYH